jgi:hypothetical protein
MQNGNVCMTRKPQPSKRNKMKRSMGNIRRMPNLMKKKKKKKRTKPASQRVTCIENRDRRGLLAPRPGVCRRGGPFVTKQLNRIELERPHIVNILVSADVTEKKKKKMSNAAVNFFCRFAFLDLVQKAAITECFWRNRCGGPSPRWRKIVLTAKSDRSQGVRYHSKTET